MLTKTHFNVWTASNRFSLLLIASLWILLAGCAPRSGPPRILIFSKTSPDGYRHQSIEAGKTALRSLCEANGILADTTEDHRKINEANLQRYATVVFLSTNGDVLGPDEEADFERYIQAGGGFVGIHAASATEYTWRWFGGLLGAYFKDHPAIQEAPIQVENCTHPATAAIGCKPWQWKEEWYNFRNYEPDIEVLLRINPEDIKGGSIPSGYQKGHPLAWCHEYDGGRSFYTALGHEAASYSDTLLLQHLLGGIRYAIGDQKPLDYSRAHTQRRPDQSRFEQTVIADHLSEPLELAELPDGSMLLIERHGYLKRYDPSAQQLRTVAKLPVYSELGDGLLGLAIDPKWSENGWIYLYYSSTADSVNHLSRFVFQDDSLHRSSEKILLSVRVERTHAFHTGGSIAFGPDGYLYLSTGDNTSPFASDGFAPIDQRPLRKTFDAQRSSGNMNDLRGKILRILPTPEGGYTCPEGNLKGGRPEIYVMGCRNPYRISVDQHRNWLYWGDVGPDAGKADTTRGPLGHDEINQARQAGNFGWPYFVGNNQPYRAYNFETKQYGAPFDAAHPMNESVNNTGSQQLPPAQSAFIWYPYGRNREFPILGTGGRNAMAGPTYYCQDYPAKTRLPGYYDGKLLIYDWMRNWLMAVTLDSLGNFYHLEPMADSLRLNRPIDMITASDGSIWMLEYGRQWYSSNDDARLSRITFNTNNRAPRAALRATPTAGAAPLSVVFKSESKDNDREALKGTLDFGDGQSLDFIQLMDSTPVWTHLYQSKGSFEVTLRVEDAAGAFSTIKKTIFVGNAPPTVAWQLDGHSRSFYQPGDTLRYLLTVNDLEDGAIGSGILPDQPATSLDYFDKNINPAEVPKRAEGSGGRFLRGKMLIGQSDCASCHAVDKTVNGPAFQAVAERYRRSQDFAVSTISRKIIYGGSGNWGTGSMSAHPGIKEEDAIEMARWILTLGDPPKPVQTLPLQGEYVLKEAKGSYIWRAYYKDKAGMGGIPSMEGSDMLLLRNATFQVEQCDARSVGVGNYKPFNNDTTVLIELKHNAWFVLKRTDIQAIHRLTLRLGSGDSKYTYCGGRMEIHSDSPSGPLITTLEIVRENTPERGMQFREVVLEWPAAYSRQDPSVYRDLYFVFKNEANQGQSTTSIDWIRFE